jgi:hypothetical protein
VAFAEAGGLRAAISLAREPLRELRLLGCGVLRHLSLATRLKKLIVAEGGLGPLFDNALRCHSRPLYMYICVCGCEVWLLLHPIPCSGCAVPCPRVSALAVLKLVVADPTTLLMASS